MDGYKVGTEECDDGDSDDTNGCSNTSTINLGYSCSHDAGTK